MLYINPVGKRLHGTEVIATSEVYNTETACKSGIKSVQTNCSADVEDQTVENVAQVKNPKYEIYTDKSGEFRFRLKARNGEIIATSEGYKSKSAPAFPEQAFAMVNFDPVSTVLAFSPFCWLGY